MTIPDKKEQRNIIRKLEQEPLTPGETACAIAQTWFTCWQKYVGYPKGSEPIDTDEMSLPPIDNKSIAENGRLKTDLLERVNYQIINRKTYEQLLDWFGGGPQINIKVVEDDNGRMSAITRIIPIELYYQGRKKKTETYSLMKVGELHQIARKLFEVPESQETKLIEYFNKRISSDMEDEKYIRDFHIIARNCILLDSKGENGVWDSDHLKFATSTSTSAPENVIAKSPTRTKNQTSPSRDGESQRGIVGFSNLGNTCFFNSGTQCLMNTRPLIKYMLNDDWEADLNEKNPIGMKGNLAKAFASLAKEVWSGESSVIAPRQLKSVVGKYAPQFSGWGQQDSQELILFTLDGVHEDLNRCKKKAQIEPVEGDGTDDESTAIEAWKRHKMRNDSIVVDLIHGQLRSRLICPECHKKTVVFDPFMSIQMPINRPHTVKLTFTFIPFEYTAERQVMKCSVPCSASGINNDDLAVEISKRINRDVKVITGARHYASASLSWGIREEPSSTATYYAFEVPDPVNGQYMVCSIKMEKKKKANSFSYYNSTVEIGTPFLLDVKSLPDNFDTDTEELTKQVEERLSVLWNPPKDLVMSESMESLKQKLSQTKDSEIKDDEKIAVSVSKSYYSDTKSLAKNCKLVITSTATILVNTEYQGLSYESLLMHSVDENDSENSMKGNKDLITLKSCFEYFSTPEVLDEDNKWFCPKCRQFVCAEKKLDVWSVPEILIIQLKRFIAGRWMTRKLDQYVDFPEELDMKKFVIGPQKNDESLKYCLYAVSNHMGGLGGGHYTAYAKVQDPNGPPNKNAPWYSFNDSHASPCSESTVHTSSAYVLFYERIKQ
ncbi:Ubiquitin carboxyl-terminal hydrolase 9 [Tritrichomonas foetus]|uniref:ubiquitinyl hydrolase 1 n=1 Tax=Tritrichomonas foetus TaxID=1144522 RepID=A0A1J4JLE5_9EUKA|nr:Ubiquitin carboxyl-terminal hydrolase 9 [Tritrichomonas foetus]|eukprot:OHS98373.1 Ubiquitin carboxyl-terminal hydrolase 9 [Tritrichomonas foetus]